MKAKWLDNIGECVRRISLSIEEAALNANRSPADVRLMGVVKSHPPEAIQAAIGAGLMLYGENKAQELAGHLFAYNENCRVHFIGHLQRNKVRQVLEMVDMVQSLDRMSLAMEIDRCAFEKERFAQVLLEINIGKETAKSGIAPEEAEDFLHHMASLKHIRTNGLMCIPPVGDDLQTERYFDAMHRLFLDIQAKKIHNVSMDILSMGMSSDFLLAVKHGSTLVRIGKAIFGERL